MPVPQSSSSPGPIWDAKPTPDQVKRQKALTLATDLGSLLRAFEAGAITYFSLLVSLHMRVKDEITKEES